MAWHDYMCALCAGELQPMSEMNCRAKTCALCGHSFWSTDVAGKWPPTVDVVDHAGRPFYCDYDRNGRYSGTTHG